MVKTKRKWETVFFEATKKKEKSTITATVELTIDHEHKTYKLCTGHEESVSFKDDSIEMSELKIDALKSAIKYAKASFGKTFKK